MFHWAFIQSDSQEVHQPRGTNPEQQESREQFLQENQTTKFYKLVTEKCYININPFTIYHLHLSAAQLLVYTFIQGVVWRGVFLV